MNVLILAVAISRWTWTKNNVKYLQGSNFLQLTLTEKNDIKNFRPCNTWFSYFSVIIKQNTNLSEKI
jgi:hypothetical protein